MKNSSHSSCTDDSLDSLTSMFAEIRSHMQMWSLTAECLLGDDSPIQEPYKGQTRALVDKAVDNLLELEEAAREIARGIRDGKFVQCAQALERAARLCKENEIIHKAAGRTVIRAILERSPDGNRR